MFRASGRIENLYNPCVPSSLPFAGRRVYIDWARGIAVLLMIEAHTTDAWTGPAARATKAFRNAVILGGFAAPLFLWLAGLVLVMSATRTAAREGDRAAAVEAMCRRGLEIFALAFLFRLQAFVVSPGGDPVMLFRVDILNVMGPTMIAAGLAWGWSSWSRQPGARVALFVALATITALATPVVRAVSVVEALPTWMQWYVRPSGEHTTFTLFPWAGFLFAGGAVGALLAASDRRAEPRLQATLSAAGACLVAFGFYMATSRSLYSTASFWTSSPAWFAIRAGILMMAVAALCGLDRIVHGRGMRRAMAPLEILGRSSLFVYWIHVELVYGYTTWIIHRRLPLWGTLTAAAALSVAMYGEIITRDRLMRSWQARQAREAREAMRRSARDQSAPLREHIALYE
jgi:uncharacterized membrane protein